MATEDTHNRVPASIVQSLKYQVPFKTTVSPEKPATPVKLPPLSLLSTQGTIPSNIWYYHKQRQKLKYLTDHPPCSCGAGRDISFLYDSASDKCPLPQKDSEIPESLIPEEYQLVKHQGVQGLDIHDEPYSIQIEAHRKHQNAFPSLRPSGRHEVFLLKNTLDHMVEANGMCEPIKSSDLLGPTQLHNLIKLIKKEQEIYNICFHELIRQVTVHCSDRGALLAEIRQRYADLLANVPLQIKSLHDEMEAQRTLDRKLMSGLDRFKELLSSLTNDLGELKIHSELAGDEIHEAKDNLSLALADSEKNANLLFEYCELYELQRKRLEDNIAYLTNERDLWESTSYDLAVKVANKSELNNIQQLQLSGKAWEKLAIHYTIVLADQDTKQLCMIQNDVQKWRQDIIQYVQELSAAEKCLFDELGQVEQEMHHLLMEMRSDNVNSNISNDMTHKLWKFVSKWLKILNHHSDSFSGEQLLDKQEKLQQLKTFMSKWCNLGILLIQHHLDPQEHQIVSSNGATNVPFDKTAEQAMCNESAIDDLTYQINLFMKSLVERTCGEDGIATGFVKILTPLESWDAKFSLLLNTEGAIDKSKSLGKSDFNKFTIQLDSWLKQIQNMINILSATSEKDDSDSGSDAKDITYKADRWCSLFCHGLQVENTQIMEQVKVLHGAMVHWMIDMLLCLTSDNAIATDSDMQLKLFPLHNHLKQFTADILKTCNHLFKTLPNKNQDLDINEELKGLTIFKNESQNWIRYSEHALKSWNPNQAKMQTKTPQEATTIKPKELPETVFTIGSDDNVKEKSISMATDSILVSLNGLDLKTEEDMPRGRDGRAEDMDRIILELDEVKQKLNEQEAKVTLEQERADDAEKKLHEAQEQISQLSAELKQYRDSHLDLSSHKLNKKSNRTNRSKGDKKKGSNI